MKDTDNDGQDLVDWDRLIDEIAVDAHGDDERLWAFHQAFKDGATLPCDAHMIGEPVSRRSHLITTAARGAGLTARCRREDGAEPTAAML